MPKITYTNKETLVTNPNPNQNKVTAGDMNEIKVSVNELYDVSGHVVYSDTVHTESNKQVLTAGIDNNITIADSEPDKTQAPLELGNAELWTGDKITPIRAGDSYVIRFTFSAQIANDSGFFDVKIDIDGAIGDIVTRVESFPKGNNVPHDFSFTMYVYTRATFKQNGGNLQINPSHIMNIWNKNIAIERLHRGR